MEVADHVDRVGASWESHALLVHVPQGCAGGGDHSKEEEAISVNLFGRWEDERDVEMKR